MSRLKSETKEKFKTNIQQPPNSWLCVLKEKSLKQPSTEENTPDIVTLRHPNRKQSAMFLFSADNSYVQEILTFNEEMRSWFIDDHVKSDGKMQICTPIDPLFLLLPYLFEHCKSYAMPVEQILFDDEYPETTRILQTNAPKYVYHIADKKGDEDLNAYKYNEEKTLNWLLKKAERTVDVLKEKNIHVNSKASATFVTSGKDASLDENSYLLYAHGIISEYLNDELSEKFLQYLEKTKNVDLKRKSSTENLLQPNLKKVKIDDKLNSCPNLTNLNKPEINIKKTTNSLKDKVRAKAASGSKNISSFFKKK